MDARFKAEMLDLLRDRIAALVVEIQGSGLNATEIGVGLYAFSIGMFDLSPEQEHEMKLRLMNVLQESGYLEKEPAS